MGIITNRDLRFLSDYNMKIKEVMTKENLVTAPVGTYSGRSPEDPVQLIRLKSFPLWMRTAI